MNIYRYTFSLQKRQDGFRGTVGLNIVYYGVWGYGRLVTLLTTYKKLT